MKFEPGDVVWLKSGGVAMTVESVYDNGKVSLIWDTGARLTTELVQPWCLTTKNPEDAR